MISVGTELNNLCAESTWAGVGLLNYLLQRGSNWCWAQLIASRDDLYVKKHWKEQ